MVYHQEHTQLQPFMNGTAPCPTPRLKPAKRPQTRVRRTYRKQAHEVENRTAAARDLDLVRQCQQGNEVAFEQLMQLYETRVFSLIFRITHDREAVEPLAQEVFLKVFRSLHTFKGDSQFYTWLYRITINTCFSYMKRPCHQKSFDDPEDMYTEAQETPVDNPEEQFMRKELSDRLMDTLEKLPDELRSALVLREFMGLQYDEIAESLQVPMGTVRSRIFRARSQMKEEMRAYL